MDGETVDVILLTVEELADGIGPDLSACAHVGSGCLCDLGG